jgi:hypothetical protein
MIGTLPNLRTCILFSLGCRGVRPWDFETAMSTLPQNSALNQQFVDDSLIEAEARH